MMPIRLVIQLAVLVLVLGTAEAQVVNSVTIGPVTPYAVDTQAQTLVGPSAEMREIFRQRSENVRLHHRPTPLEPVPPQELFNLLQSAPPPPPATEVRATDAGVAAAATQVITNRGLISAETNSFTGIVDEPSVAVRGNEVLITGNWFAAFSWNAGGNFTYMDPTTVFPAPPNETFCCDQLTYYDRGRDLMVWVLQYAHSPGDGTNRLRVAVARGGDIPARAWRYYDFTPQSVGGWTDQWFDFPALATSQNFLYLTTNSFGFGASGSFKRAIILRLPLDQLANYQSLSGTQVFQSEFGSLRPVHGAGSTMYIATHRSAAQVRIYEWPEASASLNIHDVTVTPWSTTMVSVPGTEWLGRADGRISAAWLAGGRIGLGWTAGRDATFPHAHARIARINVGNWTLADQPYVWSSTIPYAYPTAAPNASGQVALGVVYGTIAGRFPSHAVGVRNDATGSWDLLITSESTAAPSQPVWGDYFTMGLHGQNANEWVTAAFTLSGGSSGADIVPRYVHFRLGTSALTGASGYQPPK